jgi:CheY-like chemotaxis protein
MSTPRSFRAGSQAELRDAAILIVDEQPARTEPLCAALGAAGIEVVTATNGPQAKQQLLQRPIDLVLLHHSPTGGEAGMDSYELCSQIKLPPQTRSIPVVFLGPASFSDPGALVAPAAGGAAKEAAGPPAGDGAAAEVADRIRAFHCGAADFVSAPMFFFELLARLEHHMRIGRRQRDL